MSSKGETMVDPQVAAPIALLPRPPRHRPGRQLADQLRLEAAVPDADFDAIYPEAVREVSSRFWTPVEVAMRAAQLLVTDRATRVLDIGAGVGKFCIVGALSTGASFTGVEHRGHLVDVARLAAAHVGARRAKFVQGRFHTLPWETFDAFYFFNPFVENVFPPSEHLDATVELSSDRCLADLTFAEELLSRAKVGARVATYHGFGGDMPKSYELLRTEPLGSDYLELWVKGSAPRH
jgi:SAM-dependent methyltransferase